MGKLMNNFAGRWITTEIRIGKSDTCRMIFCIGKLFDFDLFPHKFTLKKCTHFIFIKSRSLILAYVEVLWVVADGRSWTS